MTAADAVAAARARNPTLTYLGRGAAVAVPTALALALLYLYGVNVWDEAWFLQVADRVASGDALYEDVRYSPLPLAVWVAAATASVAGSHILVIKTLVAACWAVTAVFTFLSIRLITRSAAVAAVGAGALLAVSPPQPQSLYNPLAMTFFTACLWATVRYEAAPTARAAALAGAFAGAAFGTKQSIGGLALVAALLALVVAGVTSGGRWLRPAAATLAAFAVVTAAVLLPVAVAGASGELLHSSFLGKTATYVPTAAVGYVDTLSALAAIPPRDVARLAAEASIVLLPLVAGASLGWWLWRARPPAALATCVVAFSVAAFGGAYPRFDSSHLAWAAPPLVVAVAAGLGAMRAAARTAVLAAFAAAAATAAFAVVWLAADAFRSSERTLSALPHFRGVSLAASMEAEAQALAAAARADPETRSTFLVAPEAGFLYLASGIENPTPFDFPAASSMGPREVAALTRAVRSGDVARACVYPRDVYGATGLRPDAAVHVVTRHMRRAGNIGSCGLWAAPPDAASP